MTAEPLTPTTTHGRYVLTTSRLHGWAAFDANDILLIEQEALDAARKASPPLDAVMALVEERERYFRSGCGWCKDHPERPCDAHKSVSVRSADIRAALDPTP